MPTAGFSAAEALTAPAVVRRNVRLSIVVLRQFAARPPGSNRVAVRGSKGGGSRAASAARPGSCERGRLSIVEGLFHREAGEVLKRHSPVVVGGFADDAVEILGVSELLHRSPFAEARGTAFTIPGAETIGASLVVFLRELGVGLWQLRARHQIRPEVDAITGERTPFAQHAEFDLRRGH